VTTGALPGGGRDKKTSASVMLLLPAGKLGVSVSVINPLLLTVSVLPLARTTPDRVKVPSPAVVVFCPPSDTAAPLMVAPLAAARTRPETVSVLSRVSTTVTFESAEPVAARADGRARPCAAHHKTSNGKRRCLRIRLVVFIKLLILPCVKAAQRNFSVVIYPGGSE
jgi:hypothetical protein